MAMLGACVMVIVGVGLMFIIGGSSWLSLKVML